MDKVVIQIRVLDRQFTTKVDQEEAVYVQKAAQIIDQKLREFQAQYRNQSELDLALGCCIEILTDTLKEQDLQSRQVQSALSEVATLDRKLDQILDTQDKPVRNP
ncbi:cell division protein ZapA [Pontibacter sp. G13]|uniref:cell division protein ZapA n=1 Tax=Pontibacter sp. G13 TaxID=3074898 RepID=UPI0028890461|nr:cell division protein ZapA [Pontibacter sp. G13]WNJ21329.1 cell division protein ZapA [Pontibacter sp. G13]